ncbi:MAG: methyltransferase domain-containing protein, partial [Actinobacteria bacterium]|nr:methyltransferase domain-containing protein [Actinomycetota bacterium]
MGDTGESRTYAFVKEILKEIELPMGARVLDFGCGSGNVLRALSRLRPDLFLDGFDLDSRAEARLRSIPNLINFFSKDPPTSGGYQ